jgi:flagellar protein FliS
MSDINPYQEYTNDSILNSNPLGLVVALYEAAIEASVNARKCLSHGDIPGRTKYIKKIINILTELITSLNDEKGGEVSANLRRLYAYIQGRVLDAHLRQRAAPLEEAERLFSTMLEGWKGASAKLTSEANGNAAAAAFKPQDAASQDTAESTDSPYGFYMPDAAEYGPSSAYSF